MPATKGAIIVLTGLAGVGKSTIARELHKLPNRSQDGEDPPPYATHSTLFSHHLIIDYVRALTPPNQRLTREHMHHRKDLHDKALKIITENDESTRMFILTAYTLLGVEGEMMRADEMQSYVDIAKSRHVPFLWFHLVCNPEEHKRRIENPNRPPTKIKDYAQLMANVAKEEDKMVNIHANGLNCTDVMASFLTVDVSGKLAKSSAMEIMNDCAESVGVLL
jgi:thymidylate kinase